MTESIIFLSALACGWLRWWDGSDKTIAGVKVLGVNLFPAVPLVAAAFAAVWTGGWPSALVALAMAGSMFVAMTLGTRDWSNSTTTALDFGLPAGAVASLVAVASYADFAAWEWTALAYPVVCALIYQAYKQCHEQAARFVVGFTLAGGFAFF